MTSLQGLKFLKKTLLLMVFIMLKAGFSQGYINLSRIPPESILILIGDFPQKSVIISLDNPGISLFLKKIFTG